MSLTQKIEVTKALLQEIERDYSPAVFANSFGAEDMVLTDLVAKHTPRIGSFSLDTGRLHGETYKVMQQARERYTSVTFAVYYPNQEAIEQFVNQNGINAFYNSVDMRKKCCGIRKVEPLKRALVGKKAWITGLRREQAVSRTALAVSEFDKDNGLQKFNPLAEWTLKDVWDYIRENNVPYNELHDRNFPSIGCEPCTRAVTPGEDVRAGRWWWENPETKECGLHPVGDKLVRVAAGK
jgi:phosphoadenosine phosphosulfate reductase